MCKSGRHYIQYIVGSVQAGHGSCSLVLYIRLASFRSRPPSRPRTKTTGAACGAKGVYGRCMFVGLCVGVCGEVVCVWNLCLLHLVFLCVVELSSMVKKKYYGNWHYKIPLHCPLVCVLKMLNTTLSKHHNNCRVYFETYQLTLNPPPQCVSCA